MSPNSTSNTMLMDAALVIESAAEREEEYTTNTAQCDTGKRHSTAPSVPQNKSINTGPGSFWMLRVWWRGSVVSAAWKVSRR